MFSKLSDHELLNLIASIGLILMATAVYIAGVLHAIDKRIERWEIDREFEKPVDD